MNKSIFFLSLMMLAATPALAVPPDADPDLTTRVNQLETQTQLLQAELQWLREHPVRLPTVNVTPASMTAAPAPAQADDADYYTLDELKGEMKKLAWTKGEFKVVPYGFLWASMAYESSRTREGDTAFWVLSPDTRGGGEDAFHVNARATRLGIDVSGPRIPFFCCGQSGGKVEIDFWGNFIIENKGTVLLRHAYWEVKDETFRLLAGQTWDVIAPLNPGTVMYSVYWDAGNIGYRRPQFRAERYLAFSDTMMLTLQGALATDAADDILGTGVANGDHAGWPIIEGRTAITLGPRGKGCRPITLGLFGHIGEQTFDFDLAAHKNDHIRTWSAGLDLSAPITSRLGFQGELFMGEDLGTFLGGIGQGVDIGTRQAIYAQGGWMEVWYYWTPRLHSHVGYTVDNPLDREVTSADGRIYNQACWGNIIFDVTKQLNIGLEVQSWRTLFASEEPGNSTRIEFMAKYGF